MPVKSAAVNQVVCPGDCLLELPDSGEVRVGAGVFLKEGFVLASKSGRAKQTQKGKLWIKGDQKNYVPAVDELVLGVIKERVVEAFKVDINGPFHAELPVTAFENVTKRNIPALKRGEIIYARITGANRCVAPTLSCVNSLGKSGGMGVLKGGCTFEVSTRFAGELLSKPPHPCLVILGGSLKFEIVVGLNGWCWVDSPSPASTILVINTVKGCQDLSHMQAEILAKSVCTKLWHSG
ncbi:hypothetical protein BSKO_05900 [Bryopsis sp. KO-2023]|nr:hypothetical protein BSKO_05900 [Bryopsis sp. KO-2023]